MMKVNEVNVPINALDWQTLILLLFYGNFIFCLWILKKFVIEW